MGGECRVRDGVIKDLIAANQWTRDCRQAHRVPDLKKHLNSRLGKWNSAQGIFARSNGRFAGFTVAQKACFVTHGLTQREFGVNVEARNLAWQRRLPAREVRHSRSRPQGVRGRRMWRGAEHIPRRL